jgi:N-acetylmuramoyl-L-alanine amidase
MKRILKLLLVIHCFLFIVVLSLSCEPVAIVDKPIVFNDLRDSLSLQYLKTRYNIKSVSATITPKMIVVHWTAIPTLEASFEAFNSPLLPNARANIASAGSLNVSAHFLVDRNGTIYQLMPETTMARHVIGLNHCAIGIENVGSSAQPLTKKQLHANSKLIKYLSKKYDISYLLGHYEYTDFEGHELWLETDATYRTEKIDPGATFMSDLRKLTANLGFKTHPTLKVK